MRIPSFLASLLSATVAALPLVALEVKPSFAQSITPAADGTGTVITTPDGQTYNITGGTLSGDGANLFQSFEQLGLDAGEVANFLSRPDVQNILGRVVGGDPSVINGLIQVTGGNSNLYLVNPAGMVFGEGAQLDVPAAFTATTADRVGFGDSWFNASGENDYSALVGNPDGFAFTNQLPGSIVNTGDLAVGEGQNLSLVGGSVVNTGTLSAPGGNITIAAVPGSNRVRISQNGMILDLEPVNPGGNGITAASLPDLLTGGEASSQADGIEVADDGSIYLTNSDSAIPAASGTAVASGDINTASSDAGGNVAVLGDRVAVVDADIDASGETGGGNIYIGGDYQGEGALTTASRTYVSADSVISADAIAEGDAGQIIVWADDITGFYGSISAQGGAAFGDGGFVEVSGKDTLIFEGDVTTAAVNGEFGTLLLDPKNIAVVGGIDDGDDDADLENALGPDPDAASAEVLASEPPTGGTFTIYESELEGMSGDTNITLEATNNVSINDLPDDELLFEPGSGEITFTADADDDGVGSFIMNGSTDVIRAEGRNVNISGAALTVAGIDTSSDDEAGNINLTSSGGDIKINNGLSANSVDSEAGAITLDVTQDLGAINISSSGVNVTATSENGEGGNITFNTAGGNITTLNVDSSTAGEGTAGDIDFNIAANSEGTGQIDTSSGTIDASSTTGEGGSITFTTAAGNIDAADVTASTTGSENAGEIKFNIEGGVGSIDTTNGALTATAEEGDGGEIKLTTNEGSISTSNIDVSSVDGTAGSEIQLDAAAGTGSINTTTGDLVATSGAGAGGNVELRTFQGSISTSNIDTFTEDADAVGGQIELNIADLEGSIDTTGGALTSGGTAGDGGKIEMTTNDGNIQTGDLNSSAIAAGNGGNIGLDAGNIGSIDVTAADVNSGSVDGTAGNINLETDEGDIQIQDLDASASGDGNGGNISATVAQNLGQISASAALDASSANGNGGAVSLSTDEGNIDTASINTFSDGSGDGGAITVTVNNGLGSIDTTSGAYDSTSVGGNGGNISLSTNRGGISVSDLSSFSESDGFTGGNISLDVNGQEGSINSTTGDLSSGTSLGAGGDITLSTVDGNISTDNILSNSTGPEIGGNVSLSINEAFGDIDTSSGIIDASSDSADGGDVLLSVADGNITTSSILARSEGSGVGGNVTVSGNESTKIDTTNAAPDGSASEIDVSSATGAGGNVMLEAGFVVASSVDASGGDGLGGNITFFGDEVDIADGSVVQSNGGTLQFATFTLDQDIVVGATSNQGGSFLDIIDAEIGFLADGFSEIEIGRADGTGTIYVVSPEWQDPAIYLQPTEDGLPE